MFETAECEEVKELRSFGNDTKAREPTERLSRRTERKWLAIERVDCVSL